MDVRVVERARSGDRLAFAELVAATADPLYALAYRIVRDAHVAQDAVQQALLDAWRDLPSLRQPDRFEAWLKRLVIRACYDEVERQRRYASGVRWLSLEEPRTLDSVLTVAQRDELERALRRLSVDHRAILAMRFFLDLSLTEIAEQLEIPVGTARSRLHYATRNLRAVLDAEYRAASSGEDSA